MSTRLRFVAILMVWASAPASAQFTYTAPGTLERPHGGGVAVGAGRVDHHVYAPNIRFPIRDAPAFANSQIYGAGGYQGPGGGQCASRNYSYPWHDNYCEARSWSMPLCPSGRGHQGQDIRPATCRDNHYPAVATVSGTITSIGSYSVYLTGDDGKRYDYLHMRSVSVRRGQRVSRGQVLGRVSNAFGGTSTTIHLHFNIRGYASGVGTVYLPPYTSLVASYRDLLGDRCRPSAETCNGRDDDCDGRVDEGLTRGCGSNVGRCVRGTQTCSGGSWGSCVGAVNPRAETCNNIDDDCDGQIDDGVRRSCGSDVGRCRRGTQTCSRGSWGSCEGGIRARAEQCDGLDDDCDGAIDENLVRSCGTDVGECVAGEETCSRGAWGSCVGEVGPEPEVCDELDNDCDGETDNHEVCEIEELIAQSGVLDQRNTDLDADGDMDACACVDGRIECFTATRRGFDQQVIGPTFDATAFDDPSRYSTFRVGDLDADGRADVCLRDSSGVTCWLSDETGLARVVPGPPLSDAEGFAEAPHFTTIRLADVDGDHRDDLCARYADGLRCYRFDGHSFQERMRLPDLADARGFDKAIYYGTLRMGDIDGDGMDDVCARDSEGMRCWRSEGTRFGAAIIGPRWSDAAGFTELDIWSTIRLADVDGDGGADLCARTPDGFVCHPFDGRGFGSAYLGPALDAADGWAEREHYATLRMADVNGDGRADLCGRGRDGFACWLFTTHGFDDVVAGPPLADAEGWSELARFRSIRMGDVDGDGKQDVCVGDVGGLRCWIADGYGFPIEQPGPSWGAGWDQPERLHTIRLAGLIDPDRPAPRRWPDAGVMRDGGAPMAGEPGAGCGCRVGAPSSSRSLGSAMGIGLVLLAARIRRRRTR